mgnify:CR=1 FL=1
MSGYNWRAGKSNNAVAAETQGLVVKSKITADWLKAHGIKEKVGFIKFLIRGGVIVAEEWHHTSKFFNRTEYTSEPRTKYKRTDPIAGKTNRETLPRFG